MPPQGDVGKCLLLSGMSWEVQAHLCPRDGNAARALGLQLVKGQGKIQGAEQCCAKPAQIQGLLSNFRMKYLPSPLFPAFTQPRWWTAPGDNLTGHVDIPQESIRAHRDQIPPQVFILAGFSLIEVKMR